MANSAASPLSPVAADHATPLAEPEPQSLDHVGLNVPVRVARVGLEEELVGWLRAMGIAEGESITVLRRAAFGGPLHVRTGAGGEFAIHRSVARAIAVRAAGG